ncbi:MAG: alpha/beta hydrolase family protein [Anaerolineae bacterium]
MNGAPLPTLHPFELWGLGQDSPYRAMLLDFIEGQAMGLAEQLSRPATRESWEARRAELRVRLRHSLGLDRLPERTPLRAQIVGGIERAGYTIQKLVYESLPGFTVTAHLYLPQDTGSPVPAVLYAPGHWMENCKLEPDIQLFCANLARRGFVVLVYDPIGQGERLGDWRDHGHLEPLLVGLSQAGLMVWESMRAIDYLVSRREVDSRRIGMTGASGGGLNTFYTSALDERVQVSVPVCYVTTFLAMMTAERDRNWEDGVDLCNQVPGVMAYAEMSDICGLFAPKPLCIIAGIRDWMFPIAGVRQVYPDIDHIYQLLGAGTRVRLAEVDAEHGYNQAMRETAYGWLARWLRDEGDSAPVPEQECELLPAPYHPALTYMDPPDPAHLPVLRRRDAYPQPGPGLCLPAGQTAAPGPAITELTRHIAGSRSPDREPPSHAGKFIRQREQLIERVKGLLGPFPERTLVQDRIYNQTLQRGLFAERVVFESEPGIVIPAIFAAPAEWKAYLPVVLYVDEWGKRAGLANGTIDALLAAGLAVFAIDVRGVGETAATDFEAATNALMTDRPLFGQRVYDVLRALDCLWRRIYIGVQIDKGRIACLGRGVGGLLALYAAALDERLDRVVAWEAPLSYHALITQRPGFPASVYLFDVLNHFDLPDLMAALAPRPLLLADPVDGERRPLPAGEIEEQCKWPRQAYTAFQAAPRAFQVLANPGQPAQPGEIAGWLASSHHAPAGHHEA